MLVSKAGVRTRRTGDGGAVVDASRGSLLDTLDASLARLGTDHLDLWLVQSPDPATPIEETVGALEHAVRTGRTRYVGLSNFPAWTTAQAATLLSRRRSAGSRARRGWPPSRWSTRCCSAGSSASWRPPPGRSAPGVLAWSPLGRGVLTGKYRHSVPASSRAASPHLRGLRRALPQRPGARGGRGGHHGGDRPEAQRRWRWRSPGCATPRACARRSPGARTAGQLRGVLAASDLTLPDPIRAVLDEVTSPELGYPERF